MREFTSSTSLFDCHHPTHNDNFLLLLLMLLKSLKQTRLHTQRRARSLARARQPKRFVSESSFPCCVIYIISSQNYLVNTNNRNRFAYIAVIFIVVVSIERSLFLLLFFLVDRKVKSQNNTQLDASYTKKMSKQKQSFVCITRNRKCNVWILSGISQS